MSVFTRKKITHIVEQMYPVKRGLFDMFWGNKEAQPSDTKEVTIEIIKGNRGSALYSARGTSGNQVEHTGYEQTTLTPPYISEKMITTAGELFYKDVGDNPYKKKSQRKRALRKLGEDFAVLKARAERAKLLQARDLLKSGKISYKVNGKTYTIDFKMPSKHKIVLDSDNVFTNPNSDPIKLIREYKRLIVESSGLTPDVIIMGADVLDAYFANPNVKEYYDNRRMVVETIKADATVTKDGLTKYGKVEGMDLCTFEEYISDGTTTEAVMPKDYFFMGCSEAKVSVEYGALPVIENGLVYIEAKKELSYVITEENSESMVAKHKTAPLVCLSQSDAFLSCKAI